MQLNCQRETVGTVPWNLAQPGPAGLRKENLAQPPARPAGRAGLWQRGEGENAVPEASGRLAGRRPRERKACRSPLAAAACAPGCARLLF